jgi:hypothetical protein
MLRYAPDDHDLRNESPINPSFIFCPYSPSIGWSMRSWESEPRYPFFGKWADSQDRMDQTPTIAWEGKETAKSQPSAARPCSVDANISIRVNARLRAKVKLMGFAPRPSPRDRCRHPGLARRACGSADCP